MAAAEDLAITVAYALPDRQWLFDVRLAPGTTARQALLASPLALACPELDLSTVPLGIHGERVPDDRVLRDGDRVEVYRALANDPRAARRAAVARGATVGRVRSPGGTGAA